MNISSVCMSNAVQGENRALFSIVNTGPEDLIFGRQLRLLGIVPGDTRDTVDGVYYFI